LRRTGAAPARLARSAGRTSIATTRCGALTFDNGFAIGGVDLGLNDLAGKALGVPAHALHGGAERDWVRAYASLPGYYEDRGPEDHWVEEAARARRERLWGDEIPYRSPQACAGGPLSWVACVPPLVHTFN